jgi:hypothetical protein
MSFGATKLLSASGGKAYEIKQSLKFDRTDNPYLERTPSSAGNRRTWTVSAWIKPSVLAAKSIFSAHDASTETNAGWTWIGINSSSQLQVGGWSTNWRVTNRLFRDVSSWYHIFVVLDTTQGTAGNRVKVYVNGVEETSFATSNNPSENEELAINSTIEHQIGAVNYSNRNYWDGYIAEVYLLDGTAKAITDFGETDSETGQWIPKKTGFSSSEYGTNGFYLKFVSGALGTDSSGEGNNYTTTRLANADVLLDTPTNNYPTINSLEPYNSTILTIRQGNLQVYGTTYDSGYYGNSIATFKVPESGKWYIETRMAVYTGTGNTSWIGVMPQTLAIIPKDGTGATDGNYAANSSFTGMVADLITGVDTIRLFDGGSAQATVSSATATSYIIALALDVDNNKVYGGYNSGSGITWLASGDPAAGSNGQAHTFTSDTIIQLEVGPNAASNSNSMQDLNFGQNGTFSGQETAGGNTDSAGEGNFFYSPPSGFKALCSKNLPSVTIKKPTAFFDIVLYTGSGSDRNITSYSFQPDFLWLKSRETAYHHRLIDSVRGSTRSVYSDSNAVELVDDYGTVGSFLSNGFSLRAGTGSNANQNGTNASGDDMVAWAWKVGGTAPSKTYAVKVVSDTGNKYRFDDYGTSAVTLNLQEGGTYTFDQSDSSNSGHPLRFSTTSDGSHGGGSEYTTGVTTNGTPGSSGAYTRITVAASAATLYYYCTAHSGMGGQVNTNSTFGATNLDGSILSVVSESTTTGLSIVSYTGTGANATVGHELGVAPSMVVVKNRDTDDNWRVYSRNDATDYLAWNWDGGSTDDNTSWNDTAPTSSVFSIGTDTNTNRSGDDFIGYCFAEVEGFSKFGSYKGNGNANGTYIYTGFRPAWTMIKRTDSTNSWIISDSKISPINLIDDYLAADLAQAEATTSAVGIDFLSNGFKIRNNANAMNNSSGTYFYMAFAKFPFKYANAR